MPALVELQPDEPTGGSPNGSQREKIVIVGLGMVAISLMYAKYINIPSPLFLCPNNCSEKIIKQDTAKRFDILVIGEEPHVAYNRVGLSSYFEHRKIEDLYLEPEEWVSDENIKQ